MATMVRPESGGTVARIVELRGVEPGFPFYGTLGLQGGVPFTHDLLEGGGALVGPDLLAQLGLQVGDRIIIGGHPFTIRGVIEKEPGRSVGGFSLGARVLVDLDGSASDGAARLRQPRDLPDAAEAAGRDRGAAGAGHPRVVPRSLRLRAVLPLHRESDWRQLRARRELPESRRVHHRRARRDRRLERHARLRAAEDPERRDSQVRWRDRPARCWPPTCCRWRCSRWRAACSASAWPGRRWSRFRRGITAALGDIPYGLTSSAVLQGLAVGLLVSLLFALVPLLDIRGIKPLLLLRGADMAGMAAAGRRRTRAGVAGRHRLAAGGRRRRRRRGAGRGRLVAGRFVAGRSRGVDRVRRRGHRAVRCRLCDRQGGVAARLRSLVPAAARGHQPAAARQPDARHPAVGRARLLLRPRLCGRSRATSSRNSRSPAIAMAPTCS